MGSGGAAARPPLLFLSPLGTASVPLGAEGVGARERAGGRSGRVPPDVVGRRVGLSGVTSCGGRERRRQVAL